MQPVLWTFSRSIIDDFRSIIDDFRSIIDDFRSIIDDFRSINDTFKGHQIVDGKWYSMFWHHSDDSGDVIYNCNIFTGLIYTQDTDM